MNEEIAILNGPEKNSREPLSRKAHLVKMNELE
jgi:hypothetical protein